MNSPRLPGLYYDKSFLTPEARAEILAWLSTLEPIWENRYSASNPPPAGKSQRQLLRPVYWLGNWQFACLNYYHPPKGILNRCVKAEPFPPVLQKLVKKMETISHRIFSKKEIPPGWHLNTCLINLYGDHLRGERKEDVARVGEHKDFEPGPVASLSLGERAMFQFVRSHGRESQAQVVFQQWLDDSSLQIFGGERLKSHLFHRVQRVDKKGGFNFMPHVTDFRTRRINFTFRYVPNIHIRPFAELPRALQEDVRGYMEKLATSSAFFKKELMKAAPRVS